MASLCQLNIKRAQMATSPTDLQKQSPWCRRPSRLVRLRQKIFPRDAQTELSFRNLCYFLCELGHEQKGVTKASRDVVSVNVLQ